MAGVLKFFGGGGSAPDQTTPKASDQRNPFDFLSPARKGSTAQPSPAGAASQREQGSSSGSGSAGATPSGSQTPSLRASHSYQGEPTTPGASIPPTPGGSRAQATTGAADASVSRSRCTAN
ncbi:uncharacterized protein JCM10292_006236 [Rhodotorula paludigena]|uniref:uncharacterized protein n=1 Tax=Rhodotorula paludigena TaxID=86838 RepID=UPI0031825AB1